MRNFRTIEVAKETIDYSCDRRDQREHDPHSDAHKQDEEGEQESVDAARVPRIGEFALKHIRRGMGHHRKEGEAAYEHEGDREVQRQSCDRHDARPGAIRDQRRLVRKSSISQRQVDDELEDEIGQHVGQPDVTGSRCHGLAMERALRRQAIDVAKDIQSHDDRVGDHEQEREEESDKRGRRPSRSIDQRVGEDRAHDGA